MSLKDKLLDTTQTSKFGLAGNKGPEFENQGRANYSEIQAFLGVPQTNTLRKSQDLLSGRMSNQIPGHPYFQRASEPPVSFPDTNAGKPAVWGEYSKGKGPADGRY